MSDYSVFDEMLQWWEDCTVGGIGGRLVLLAAPFGWGKSSVLESFNQHIEEAESAVWVLRIDGARTPTDAGLLAKYFDDLTGRDNVLSFAEQIVGLDSPEGAATLAVNIAGLTVAPELGGAIGLALTMGLYAESVARMTMFPNPAGIAERSGARLARASREAPVVVLVDNGDAMDPAVADAFLTGAVDRMSSNVLAVVAVEPGCELVSRLSSPVRFGPLRGRLRRIDVPDAAMTPTDRRKLCHKLASDWPEVAVDRLVSRTRTFDEIRQICNAPSARDLSTARDPLTEVDRLADQILPSPEISLPALVVAWCGGVLHREELAAVAEREGWGDLFPNPSIQESGGIVRLAQPAALTRLQAAFHVRFDRATRRRVANVIATIASEIIQHDSVDLFTKAAALRCIPLLLSADDDPPDLEVGEGTLALCAEMVDVLRQADDLVAVAELAGRCVALADNAGVAGQVADRLTAARLALAALTGETHEVATLAGRVDTGQVSVLGIEARVWSVIVRLQDPETRGSAIDAAMAVEPLLDRTIYGTVTLEWRFLLGAELIRLEATEAARKMLTPILELPVDDPLCAAAEGILVRAHGPASTHLLAIINLEAELTSVPEEAIGDRLRVTSALASLYTILGDWEHARQMDTQKLQYCIDSFGPDHPQTLAARNDVAQATGDAGEPAEAQRLCKELLPDRIRIQGRDHPGTLTTRNNLAHWTGAAGYPKEALRLYKELLPDRIRIQGPDHPDTLKTKNNVAALTGYAGHPKEALRLFKELLPAQIRAVGPDHPQTLVARNNVAMWTGTAGDPNEALRLSNELLPDRIRVLGPDHPGTLTTRNNIAYWTAKAGNPKEALRLYKDLLRDLKRVLGPNHPDTINTAKAVEFWTRKAM